MNTEWTAQDSAALDAALVAHDGHRMPLRGMARRLAIESMARQSLTGDVMAERLCISRRTLQNAARRAGVAIPTTDLRRWAVVGHIADLRERDRQRGARRAAA